VPYSGKYTGENNNVPSVIEVTNRHVAVVGAIVIVFLYVVCTYPTI
jgi:hypothetical protein